MPGSIQSLERAAAIMRLVAASPGLGLADISTSLRLPKGTAHGLLRTMGQVGMVERDRATGRYRLGPALGDPSHGCVDLNELRARSFNWADPLASRTGEAALIGVLRGVAQGAGEVVVVHHVFRPDDSPQEVEVGAVLPAHATALGKVLLAYHPRREQVLSRPLARFTRRTLADPSLLLGELGAVRRQRYAVEVGESLADQAGIAAPVHGYGGLVVAAVAIRGRVDRVCDGAGRPRPDLVAQVRDCARSITRELDAARLAVTAGPRRPG